ncbi:hypothetical protein F5B20DRAFT_234126 [Whalleya microplaca]|nr:hypothetical protein F5B20DRAFT_234126 [Whalleya microplaca]
MSEIAEYDTLSDEGWRFVQVGDKYYTTNFTPNRPPHLNDENFSSAQNDGPGTQPRQLVDAVVRFNVEHIDVDMEGNYTLRPYAASSESVNTENTLKTGDPFANHIGHLDFILSRNYDGSIPALTEQAIAALNHSSSNQHFGGNITNWIRGQGPRFHGDITADDLSSSKLMPPGPRSHTTTKTSDSSWSKISSVRSHGDHMAENIQKIGVQFDIVANPNTILARTIRDEDLR